MKTICTLEFRDGRPVAKEVNPLGDEPKQPSFIMSKWISEYHLSLEQWQQAESERLEFEIEKTIYSSGIHKPSEELRGVLRTNDFVILEGDRFTATIENNLVTKIELI